MDNKEIISQPLKLGQRLLWIGIPLCLLSPIIFTTSWGLIDFTETGNIGDTIGGISAPFINIMGAILIFLALKAQVQANILVQNQITGLEKERKLENESKQINQYYSTLKSSIDGFKFTTLDRWSIGESDKVELTGSEAIYKLFQDFYCDFHIDEAEIKCNPKITEIMSMLEICDTLLEKIRKSDIPDKETLWTLTRHQFLYRIFPRMSTEYPSNLEVRYCENCKSNHGLPDRFCKLLEDILHKLNYNPPVGTIPAHGNIR